MDTKEEGRFLALCATMRALIMHTARTANPKRPGDWMASVGQAAGELVADIQTADLADKDIFEIDKSAEEALRLIFDNAVFDMRRN